jgi:hypothetical protein
MMPPLLATIRIERRDGRSLRLWLPLFLFWLIALPFVVVALPVVAVVLAVMGRRPFAIIAAYWAVLGALSGTDIELNGRRSLVAMHVY